MAAPLTWNVTERDGCLVMSLHGRLDLPGATGLRTALLKSLAEQPAALLVDLSGVTGFTDLAPSVFTATVRQAATWPGIPMLLCGARPEVAVALGSGRFGLLPLQESLAAGLATVAAGEAAPPMISDQLLPILGAPRHARDVTTEACARWLLPDLVGPACLIASELVTNAVEHAHTMMTLQLSRRSRYLHISVRDGSPVEPVQREAGASDLGGRGLKLVGSLAVHWGSMPCREGKVVWATLAA